MLSFFPLDVSDEIWDVIESVSEGCLTYCFPFELTTHLYLEYLFDLIMWQSGIKRTKNRRLSNWSHGILSTKIY